MTDFEKVIDFHNMYKAFRRAKCGKGFKKSSARFDLAALDGIHALIKQLKDKTYRVSSYTEFKVYEPKERIIQTTSFKDKVIQHSLCDNVIMPRLQRVFILDNCAGQKGKGTLFGLDRLSQQMQQFYGKYGLNGYILKCDVTKFFYNISHSQLKDIVRYHFGYDLDVCWLCNLFIDSTEGKGLPLGNQINQGFALLYLDGMDKLIRYELGIEYYGRYMDDFYLMHPSKEYLKYCLEVITAYLETLDLSLNGKTQIFPFKNGVSYLGFHTYITADGLLLRKLKNQNKRNAQKRFVRMARLVSEGKMSPEKLRASYTSSGTHVGTTTKIVNCAIPASVAPSCQIKLVEDVSGALERYGQPVQGISKLKLTIEAFTSQDAGIVSYLLEANGVKYTEQTSITQVLTTAGSQEFLATVKDTRGRSGSARLTQQVLAYTTPVVSALSVSRYNDNGKPDNQGGICRVTFSATVSPLRVGNQYKNTTVYIVEYKKSTDLGYTQIDTSDIANGFSVLGKSYDFPADPNTTYDVRVTVKDNHGEDFRSTTLSTAFTLMNWNAAGNGMGIGKVSEKEHTLEVGMDSDFYGDVFGRVYGLGALPAIPSGVDLNDYLTPGVYAARTTEIAQSLKNCPSPIAGRLVVSSALGQPITGDSEYRYIEQKFIPYTYAAPGVDRPTYLRYIVQEGAENITYMNWFNEALKAYPVGSIHLRYDHQKPADLFGGTWERISSYILRGVAEGGEIGSTVGLADGSSRTAINIAIWRRTG